MLRRASDRRSRKGSRLNRVEGLWLKLSLGTAGLAKPPVLLLHGWPGSFLEFERLLGPLAADGHDVVARSLPGFAFSKPITGIIGPRRAAELMHGLMVQLGQSRYIVQGGDWPRSFAEKTYHIVHWSEMSSGGHFLP
jgi:pimeloyl-ACP methyl ester carboxylesterase